MAKVIIDKEKCTGCGYCVNGCPHGVIVLNEDNKAEVVYPELCEFCRECVNNCPSGAAIID